MSDGYTLDQTFTHKTSTHEYQIHWTRLGRGSLPPLVFIHGTPWSSVVWQSLASSLSSRYNVYLYDHPGFGVSPPPRRTKDAADSDQVDLDASLQLRAEASAALLRHWGFGDRDKLPHVVAHDNGGLVSLRLLQQHNLQFASLCLIDVVALSSAETLPFFKLVADNEGVFKAIPPHLVEGLVRAYVRSAAYKPLSKEIEDILSKPWLMGGNQGSDKFLREMVQAHHRDAGNLATEYGAVRERRSPIKIVWGKEDAWIPFETAEKLKSALGAEEVVVVEGAGHLVHYDQPARLALEVGLWLDKCE